MKKTTTTLTKRERHMAHIDSLSLEMLEGFVNNDSHVGTFAHDYATGLLTKTLLAKTRETSNKVTSKKKK